MAAYPVADVVGDALVLGEARSVSGNENGCRKRWGEEYLGGKLSSSPSSCGGRRVNPPAVALWPHSVRR